MKSGKSFISMPSKHKRQERICGIKSDFRLVYETAARLFAGSRADCEYPLESFHKMKVFGNDRKKSR